MQQFKRANFRWGAARLGATNHHGGWVRNWSLLRLAAALLKERAAGEASRDWAVKSVSSRAVKSVSSSFGDVLSHIACLPAACPLPLCWTQDELDLLGDPAYVSNVVAKRALMEHTWAAADWAVAGGGRAGPWAASPPTVERWLWAVATASARAFNAPQDAAGERWAGHAGDAAT
eukprot:gene26637-20612_t